MGESLVLGILELGLFVEFHTDNTDMNALTPFLYCLGPRVAEPKKWFFPNFIFKGWEWCIWTITTIIHHQI